VTIPADTPPGNYKLNTFDQNKRALSPDFDIVVVVVGGKGTLLVTADGEADTNLEVDFHYVISGVNLPKGMVMIYIDTAGRQQVVISAQAGASERFQEALQFKKAQNSSSASTTSPLCRTVLWWQRATSS
jgi:hypothetical protein